MVPNKAQTPYTAKAHHWIKNAATNNDMDFAALWDAWVLAGLVPSVSRSLIVSRWILIQVRR